MKFIRKWLFVKRIRALNDRIRKSRKYNEWRLMVLSKGNWKCVACGSAKYLEVDHITAFALIVKRNKIRSLKQAYGCKELWDLKNGRVLCRKCHKKTENYKKRLK